MDRECSEHDLAPAPIRALVTRRLLLQGAAAATLASALPVRAEMSSTAAPLDFRSIPLEVTPDHHVAEGYDARVVVRWGDAIKSGAPAFNAGQLTAADQDSMFGFNNDFVGYFPLPKGSRNSDHGLLFVNHEYAAAAEMAPPGTAKPEPTAALVSLEQAAIGASVVEVVRKDGAWQFVENSPYARRVTSTTPISVAGPVAGHARLHTSADPDGRRVLGTLANCAGGKTPWGTALSAEENFHLYFSGDAPAGHPDSERLFLAQVTGGKVDRMSWGKFDKRFDVSQEPNEANRFGWMVEVDPYDPKAEPVKRTALGRFRHEAASVVINHDRRIVVYLGEDRVWGFVFRFVSEGRYDAAKGVANGKLLDRGTLYVARFEEHKLVWIPLVHGRGRLTAENGFHSQADVLIDAREAAKAVGGTPMDRPEDIEASPVTGHIFVNLTRNNDRKEVHIDFANPRPENEDGHVLELTPPKRSGVLDHAADEFKWSVFLIAGTREDGGQYGSPEAAVLSGPDNFAFDPQGRLWIATDNRRWSQHLNPIPNGLYGCQAEGPDRAVTRFFYNVPAGAEMCGPEFTPDGQTLFVAVQHPTEELDPKPTKSWPDFVEGVPGRPSIVAITRKGGGMVGGG